jgi:ribosomal protein L16 Arg81 hydroxylase
MTGASLNLQALLSPIGVARFFERYWEQDYLHIQGRPADCYLALMSTEDLERIVSNPDARYPAIQLAKGGRYIAAEAYTRNVKFGSEIFSGVPDLQRIGVEYRNGASIVLPALHRTWPPLRELCAALEIQLDHVPHGNVYITPGNAAGFTPHYDVHEVFVLQIAGRKRWSIYPPITHLPLRNQAFNPQSYEAPAPTAQMELCPGDLLYLPRGYIHSAATSDSYSAHITIGISVYTWLDLTQGLLENGAADPRLRAALPAGFAKRSDLKGMLQQRLSELLKHRVGTNCDELFETFTRRVVSGQSTPPERFRIDLVAIDGKSSLRTPAKSEYTIVQDALGTGLEFRGKRHILPDSVAPLLQAISERSIFRTEELGGNLPLEIRLGLSRYLLDLGFLTWVQESPTRDRRQ